MSAAVADLSPAERPRRERPGHVATIPPPDTCRRPAAGAADWPGRTAAALDDAVADLASRGHRPAAVYVEGAFTSDGIFAPPPAYLRELVREGMRERGVPVGTTARTANVLTIRPPLVATLDDAAQIASVLEEALAAAGG